MAAVECLVLDLDDTLYPERQYVLPRLAAVARHLAARFGPIVDFEAEMVAYYEGRNPGGRMFDTVLARAGLATDRGLIEELVALYRAGPASLQLYPDVRPALEKWKRRMPLALVTDGHPATQRKKVEALGLAGYFQEVVYTGELGPGNAKPSPEPFRRVNERIGFRGVAVYVGDNPILDIAGPRGLGWIAVRIIRPGGRYAGVAAEAHAQPDWIIGSLAELESIPVLAPHCGGTGTERPSHSAGRP